MIDADCVRLGTFTRKTLKAAIDSEQIQGAIIPLGSLEQHHDHLPLLHDTWSVTYLAETVAQKFYPALVVTPTVWASDSEHHMDVGGAITIRRPILIEYVCDIVNSLQRMGIKRVMVLNGHGGNIKERLEGFEPAAMQRLIERLHGKYLTYWFTCPNSFYEEHLELDRDAGHAGEFETSFARIVFPEYIREQALHDDSAKLATKEKGQAIIHAVIERLCQEISIWLS